MKGAAGAPKLIAGRLALDFANLIPVAHDLSWTEFVDFLVDSRVVGEERGMRLESLESNEPGAVDAVLLKILRLRECVRAIFSAVEEGRDFPKAWVAPINEILRVTEGHDEVVVHEGRWRLEFIGRESGLEWLLAAIARSAAELIVEGQDAPLKRCANAGCRLFFYDDSRTRRRRWCSMAVCGNRHKVAAFLKRKGGRSGD
ncbi:MAG TPA: CGNR zinc finger domain-containing protein [Candidatus Limnocylindrales bacterium]|nr:CGNR zinc finger domain-containing protein [Candidatus Limnocylindrales bacterium]